MKMLLRHVAALALAAGAAAGLGGAAPVGPISVPPAVHPGAGQVFYFVLTDRFANGSRENDHGGPARGPDVDGFDPTRISHYHGGDFRGLIEHLDYIKRLGATAVWITPPFRNKAVQAGTAGYHGYWVLDFLHVDPHLGTDDEFRELIGRAHARGLKVYMDIIANHTADVIEFRGGETVYRSKEMFPFRDADGRVFDERDVAWNGLGPAVFPTLSPTRSFPYEPLVPDAEANAKNPAWLNDVTVYHNRGNSTFKSESSVLGDFAGLDDLFTEEPRVVRGFIDIFTHWLQTTEIDGFRIDTVKHVNAEFWQAFAPAIRERARQLGRRGFLQFGEVYSEAGDPEFLSEFSTAVPLDATLDFGFFVAARNFVSRAGSATALAQFFAQDDFYTDHDSNVDATTTFLGNHDAGRFAYFLQQDNPAATEAEIASLVALGHGLLYLVRGQPVVYYGDEQGMIGRGGGDMQARESMFGSQAPEFRSATLLATTRTGADDKFDETHPFYRLFSRLGGLRAAHVALARGAMIIRPTEEPAVFAFSRIERDEQVEYIVALNNSRTAEVSTSVPTSQPRGAALRRIFDSRAPESSSSADIYHADDDGTLRVTLEPLQFAVWRAEAPLPKPAAPPTIAFATPTPGSILTFSVRETDGQRFASRQELRAEVGGGDGFGEVTFVMMRASRRGQYELVGVDDAPPYHVFWRPPPDLAAGEELTFVATFDDLRGSRLAAQIDRVKVAPSAISFGRRGGTVPRLRTPLPLAITAATGVAVTLSAEAEGTEPLHYQWMRDGRNLPGATSASLAILPVDAASSRRYRVVVSNDIGTTISNEAVAMAKR